MEYKINNKLITLSKDEVINHVGMSYCDSSDLYRYEGHLVGYSHLFALNYPKLHSFNLKIKIDTLQYLVIERTLLQDFSINLKKFLPNLIEIHLKNNKILLKIDVFITNNLKILDWSGCGRVKKIKTNKSNILATRYGYGYLSNFKTLSKKEFYFDNDNLTSLNL